MAYKYKVTIKVADTSFPVHNCKIQSRTDFHYTNENGEVTFYNVASSITATIDNIGFTSVSTTLTGSTDGYENTVYISQKKIGTAEELEGKSNSAYTSTDVSYCPYIKILTDNGNFVLYDTNDLFKCPTIDKVNYTNAFIHLELKSSTSSYIQLINNTNYPYMLSGGTSFTSSPTAITISSGYCGTTFICPDATVSGNPLSNGLSHIVRAEFNSKTSGNIGASFFSGATILEDVLIDGKITSIGNSGFTGCVALTSITLNNYLKIIYPGAFSGCTGLTEIVLPETLTSLGINAFEGCKSLTSITIPKNIVRIPNYCFNDCTGLTSVTIEGNITEIGTHAFDGCKSLTSINLPKSLKVIDNYAFNNCSGLTEIELNEGLEEIGTSAFYKTPIKNITIPSTVTRIGSDAFYKCLNLESVTIKSSTMGNYGVFKECTALKDVQLLGKISKIGTKAFSGCTSLETIDIPYSVNTIGNNAFADCTSLQYIVFNPNITTISSGVCSGCTGLTDIYFLGEVTSIEENSFTGVTQEVYVWSKDSVLIEDDYDGYFGADANYLNFTEITHGSTSNLIGVADFVDGFCNGYFIDGYGKLFTTSESNISVSEAIVYVADKGSEEISETAKYSIGYSGVTSIIGVKFPKHINNVISNGFNGCSSLSSITFYDSQRAIFNIGTGSFANCTSLKEVNFGHRISTIYPAAFSGCTNLRKLTFEQQYSEVTSQTIGPNAFSYCSSLDEIHLNSSSLTPTIQSTTFFNVKTGGTLYYNTNLDSTNLYNINMIWLGTGNYYLGLYLWKTSQSSSILVEYETTTSGVKRLYNSGKTVSGCTKMVVNGTEVDVSDTYQLDAGINKVEYILTGTTTGTTSALFSGITSGTSSDCRIISITLPDTVKTIGVGLCRGCTYLSKISYSKITTIGAYAFSGCSFDSIEIPSTVTSIGTNAFAYNSNLKDVSYATSCSVQDSMFKNCTSLDNIVFKKTEMQIIYASAFSGCTSLTNIVFPSGLTTINSNAFAGTSLSELSLNDTSINTISSSAFANCTSLSKAYFPSTITTIGDYAFSGCSTLDYIYVDKNTEPTISSNTFLGVKKYGTLRWNGYVDDETSTEFNTTWLSTGETYLGYYHWNNAGVVKTDLEFTIRGDGSQAVIGCYNEFVSAFNITNNQIISTTGVKYNLIECKLGYITTTIIKTKEIIPDGTEITFNVSLSDKTKIPDGTFGQGYEEYTNVISVILPDSVTTIEEGAFYGATNLESINLDNITVIGDLAFAGTILSTLASNKLNSIGSGAFTFSNLTSVTISNPDIKTIGGSCFSNCTYLETVDLSVCTALTSLQDRTFMGCTNLSSLTLNEGLIEIGEYVIDGDTSLTALTLPSTLITIDREAFSESGLKKISIPDSVTGLSYACFSHCRDLESVYIGSGCQVIDQNVFSECASLKSVDISTGAGSVDGALTRIESYAFNKCSDLTIINISCENVPYVYQTSFYGVGRNGNLTNFDGHDYSEWLSNDEYYLGYYSWNLSYQFTIKTTPVYANEELETSYINFKVIYIKQIYLDGEITTDYEINDNIGTFEFNDEVEHIISFVINTPCIPYDFFSSVNCIKSVTCDTVKEIGSNVFKWSEYLTSLDCCDSLDKIGISSFEGCQLLSNVMLGNVSIIDSNAFCNCISLTNFTFPDSVKEIPHMVLYGCDNLTSVTLGDSVTRIDDRAFAYTNISSIVLPETLFNEEYETGVITDLSTIGEEVFDETQLRHITVNGTNAPQINCNTFKGVPEYGILEYEGDETGKFASKWLSSDSYYLGYYHWNENNDIIIAYKGSANEEIKIVNTLTNLNGMFVNGTEVSIPSTMKYTLPNTGIITIGYSFTGNTITSGIFSGLTSIDSVYMYSDRSITTIGTNAFKDCTSLNTVFLKSNNLNTISDGVFSGCTSLSKLEKTSGITSIGSYAFSGTKLKSFTFNVSTISSGVLSNCSDLGAVKFSNSATTIGTYAFQNCKNINSLIIPSGVTTIGNYAFSGCSNLGYIYVNRTTAPTISSGTFFGVKEYGTLRWSGYTSTSTAYSTWLNTTANYLGYYHWNNSDSNYITLTFETYNTSSISFSRVDYNYFTKTGSAKTNLEYRDSHGPSTTKALIGKDFSGYQKNGNDNMSLISEDVSTLNLTVSNGDRIYLRLRDNRTYIENSLATMLGTFDYMKFQLDWGIFALRIYDDNLPSSYADKTYNTFITNLTVDVPACVTKIGKEAMFATPVTILKTYGDNLVIEGEAFRGSYLQQIYFYGTVSSINTRSFCRCLYLTDIYLYKNSTAPSILETTFRGCSGSKVTIHVPSGCSGNYSSWMKDEDYLPGYYNWTIVDDLPAI